LVVSIRDDLLGIADVHRLTTRRGVLNHRDRVAGSGSVAEGVSIQFRAGGVGIDT
jgi:hypothetical protein